MPVNFFRTIKSTLDQTLDEYCQIEGITRARALIDAKRHLVENQRAYFTPGTKLDYSQPFRRIAYIFAYVAAHANLTDRSFERFVHLKDLVDERLTSGDTLKICALGGGPGSELLGLAKYAERKARGRWIDIDFMLVDYIREWDETWNALQEDITRQFQSEYGPRRRDWPLMVSHHFAPLDLLDYRSFRNQPTRFRNIDLFISNFVVSELIDQAPLNALIDTYALLSERSRGDVLFLFIDRKETRVLDAIDEIIESSNLCQTEPPIELETYIDLDERKSDLGDWLVHLRWSPKLKLSAKLILATKNTPARFYPSDDDIPF